MKRGQVLLVTCITFLGFAVFANALVLNNPLGGGDFTTVICGIIKYVAELIAGLTVIMFVWGGILFVTSAGNESKVSTAKKVIIYAVVGTAIALAATGLIELIKSIIGANGGGSC